MKRRTNRKAMAPEQLALALGPPSNVVDLSSVRRRKRTPDQQAADLVAGALVDMQRASEALCKAAGLDVTVATDADADSWLFAGIVSAVVFGALDRRDRSVLRRLASATSSAVITSSMRDDVDLELFREIARRAAES